LPEQRSGPGIDQTANLLGALSLVLADRMADAMGEAGGRPESTAAALSALLHFLDRPTVDLLRQVLGLTSSGTVRLVDRMADSGYVQRGPGSDGRSTSVTLTGAGLVAAERVAAARAEVLEGALAGLTGDDAGWPDPRARGNALDVPPVRHRGVPRRGRRLSRRQRGPRALHVLNASSGASGDCLSGRARRCRDVGYLVRREAGAMPR